MTILRRILIIAFGGCCGLLIISLLPIQAQQRVATWQSSVEKFVSGLRSQTPSTKVGQSASPPDTVRTNNPVRTTARDDKVLAAPKIGATAIERFVHDLVNQERQKRGMRPLATDDQLSLAARGHSQDMADLSYFAHEDQRGQGPTERAARIGYTCRKNFGSYYQVGVAENIFQNWLYSSVTYVGPVPIKNYSSAEEIAASTAQGWMNSQGHRGNILDNTYDRVGTGVAISADQKVFITQDFC